MARTAKKQSAQGAKKKIKALERQVNANEREVHQVLREKEAHKRLKICQKKGSTERPKGTAGRQFNLQHAMSLDGKDTVYNKIRYKIIEIAKENGLQLNVTIRHQPTTLLGTIIILAMLEIPHLANFRDGWPVKDVLRQYLQNHGNYKRRMGYDKPSKPSIKVKASKQNKLKQAHTLGPSRAKTVPTFGDSDPSEESNETDSGLDDEEGEVGQGSEGGLPADIAELFRKRVEDFLKSKGCSAQTTVTTGISQNAKATKNIPSKSVRMRAATSSKKTTKAAMSQVLPTASSKSATQVTTQQVEKRKLPPSRINNAAVPTSVVPLPKHRARPVRRSGDKLEKEKMIVAPSSHRDSGSRPGSPYPSFSFSSQDIPDTCPNDDCEDLVPVPPSPQLIQMFRTLAEPIHKEGEFSRAVLRTTLHICGDIACENQLSQLREQVTQRGWPVSLNFVELNDFTWSLKADLAQILSDRSARASHIVWISLLDRIACHYHDKGVTVEEHLLAFARDKGPVPSFINDLSTAGFFGSKGVHVIMHALEAMFRTSTVPLDAIRPLDVKKFMNSFLVPYVATRAIANQLNVSISEAHTILLDSRSAGVKLHPALDSDEELDQICRSNIQRSKSDTSTNHHCNDKPEGPPRFRRSTPWPRHAETTPPPQPGPSRHANALQASQGNPTSRSPEDTLSQLTPLSSAPSSPARQQTRSRTRNKTKPAPVSAGDEQGGPSFRRKRARH